MVGVEEGKGEKVMGGKKKGEGEGGAKGGDGRGEERREIRGWDQRMGLEDNSWANQKDLSDAVSAWSCQQMAPYLL